jgi:hypothetical protein
LSFFYVDSVRRARGYAGVARTTYSFPLNTRANDVLFLNLLTNK